MMKCVLLFCVQSIHVLPAIYVTALKRISLNLTDYRFSVILWLSYGIAWRHILYSSEACSTEIV